MRTKLNFSGNFIITHDLIILLLIYSVNNNFF